MNQIKVKSLQALGLVLTLMIACSMPAMANVGSVLYTFGNVSVEKPAISVLRRGAILEEGDVIVTGPKGYAQLKLADGTKFALKPDTRFTIEAVEAPATATTPAIGAGTALRSNFNLEKGGVRTITGAISKRDPSAYQLTTPQAVIRVRGTHFSLAVTGGSLFMAAWQGGINASNAQGSLDMGEDSSYSFGVVPSPTSPPQGLVEPPAVLTQDSVTLDDEEGDDSDDSDSDDSDSDDSDSDDSDSEDSEGDSDSSDSDSGDSGDSDGGGDSSGGEGGSEGSGGSEGGSGGGSSGSGSGSTNTSSVASSRGGTVSTTATTTSSTSGTTTTSTVTTKTTKTEPVQEITGSGSGGQNVDLTTGDETFVARGLAFAVAGRAVGINTNDDTATFSAANNLTGFDEVASSTQTTTYAIGTASNLNAGFDPVSSIKWGRWGNGIATQSVNGAAATNLDLSAQSLHWVSIDANDTVPTQAITGSASYTLVGNTDPTDALGNVGVLGSADFSADFTNATVQSNVQLGINNQNWTANGTGSITSNLFNGLYNTVTVNGVAGGSGSFGGAFGGFSTGAVPTGAGMTYQITNGEATVSGAAVFNNAGNLQ